MKILAVISKVGLTEKILKNDRICSRHYPSGQPADLMDDTNPDWLPSFIWVTKCQELQFLLPKEDMREGKLEKLC